MGTLAAPMDLGGQSGADAGSSGGSGAGDGLGDVLSSAFDSAQEGQAEATEAAETSGDLELSPGTEEAQPVDPAAPAGNEPFPLSPDGNSYVVPKAALPQLLEAQKFQAEIGKFFQSPQEAEQASFQAHDMRVMQNDWVTGSPQSIQGVLNHLAGMNHSGNPQVQARFQQAFSQMVPMATQFLARANPQAFSQLATQNIKMLEQANLQAYQEHLGGVNAQLIENAYQDALQSQDPQDLKAAQYMDWKLRGEFKKTLGEIQGKPVQAQIPPEQLRWQQEKQAFDARQEKAYKRDVQEFNSNALEGAKFNALDAKIDTLLGKVKDRYSPAALQDMKLGIQRDVIAKLKASEWYLEHHQTFGHLIGDYEQTWKAGNPGQGLKPRVDAYVNDFLSRASRNLPEIIQSRINGTKANARTVKPSQTSAVPAKNGSPSPNGQANGRVTQDQWDKSLSDVFANLR